VTEPTLKSSRFRAEREADWRRLEGLLARIEKGSVARLSPKELMEAPVLYRQALSSLSVAPSKSHDQGLIDYLEGLCTRAYFVVYGVRAGLWERIGRFFAEDWPAAVKGLWRETLISALLLLSGVIVAYALVASDPSWFQAFMPGELTGGRTPESSTESLRATLYGADQKGLSAFATFLFTHNAQVSIMAFALGFVFGAPSAGLMVYNGFSLGALLAVFAARGLGGSFMGWILIHGTTELLACILAGAAGMSIGWAVAFPGERTRTDAAARAGRRAGVVMGGVVVMLFFAGLLEGFGRQLIQADAARYAIGAVALMIWLAYFYLPKRPT
jgi:uncharacterized membrane protein SpoIIM required for sporulation